MAKYITAPLTKEQARSLRAGRAFISAAASTPRGTRPISACASWWNRASRALSHRGGGHLLCGALPARPGQAIGSAGPTTSYRMDAYAPTLLRLGELGMIGKGKRSPAVVEAMRETGAVYFGAIGGAGALLSQCVKSAQLICYEDLGAEAVRRLEVENLPLTVVIDSQGNNLYETGRAAYLEQRR